MDLHEPPAMSATVQVALLLGDLGNSPPYFENDNYGSRIDENSPQGTVLVFGDPYITEIKDDDMGKNGIFSITLENNNGTFEISPTVGERRASFVIRVRDNALLDYEMRQTIYFTIVATEVGPGGSLKSSARVTVYLNDVNDHLPVFLQPRYEVTLPENMTAGVTVAQVLHCPQLTAGVTVAQVLNCPQLTAGVTVAQVRAQDLDTGLFGKVHYTRILGHLNTSLRLDSITGLITVSTNSHMFDRETAPEFRFNVEARDMEGSGNRATVPLIIKLIDVNDETPYFEKDQYDFFLTPSLRNFTTPAIITAMDMDAESPNNEVRYEIISGNYENNYYLHEIKGELTVRTSHSRGKMTRIKRLIDDQEDVDRSSITMTARAYDLGVPHRWSTTTIHVLPPDANTRTMMFIVNGSPPDRTQTLAMLETLTGGQVRIKDIRPYEGHEIQPISASGREDNEDRSMVVATILYDGTTMVDVRQLQKQLQANVKMSERVDKVVRCVSSGEPRLVLDSDDPGHPDCSDNSSPASLLFMPELPTLRHTQT
uniref:Cadherin domain-containing protein n=1 Tax=Timema cristinae TaxID=61476 RepID=A0A7R9GRR6_TIMCR|nr:unnamed protein product [Timema cristinae]